MDLRTGRIYATRAQAIADGVSPDMAVEIEKVRMKQEAADAALGTVAELVRVTSGPFKGRVYERLNGGGCKRRRDLEATQKARV